MRTTKRKSWRDYRGTYFWALVAVMLPSTALADKICFNQFGHPALPGPPTIPGDPADPHWSTVFRFDYHNGTPVADGMLQVGSHSGQLYFEWMVNKATGFNNADRVTLAFRDSAGNYRMIAIQPNCDGIGVAQRCVTGTSVPTCSTDPNTTTACANNQPSFAPTFHTGTLDGATGKVNWTVSAPPDGIIFGAGSTGTGEPGSLNSWYAQLKMPAAGDGYTIDGRPWKLYSNIFHVDTTLNPPTVTELTWPQSAASLIVVDATNLPPVSTWGDAQLGSGGCVGVHVTKLHTNGTLNGVPNETIINHDRSDMKISADVANTGTIEAKCVVANFRVANFGISNAWATVPAAGNPTSPQTITAGTTPTISTGNWNVVTDPNRNNFIAHPHQCIRVDLSTSTQGGCTPNLGTTFDQASYFQNMDFGHSSVFTRPPAEIRGDLGPPPPGQAKNRYELFVVGNPSVTQKGARLTLIVHGARHTGKFVDLPLGRPYTLFVDRNRDEPRLLDAQQPKTKRFEITEATPSFGYVIDHELDERARGELAKASRRQQQSAWAVDLGGLQPRALPDQRTVPGLYTIEVGVKDVARVAPRVEYTGISPTPKPDCCVSTMPKRGTTPVAVSGLLLIGLLAHRRRRDRRN